MLRTASGVSEPVTASPHLCVGYGRSSGLQHCSKVSLYGALSVAFMLSVRLLAVGRHRYLHRSVLVLALAFGDEPAAKITQIYRKVAYGVAWELVRGHGMG